MPIFSAGLTVDVVRAESARFRHPLLLVHGIWTGSWIWSGIAAYLAHRGWESWAPSFEGEAAGGSLDRVAQLVELCRALPAPPVLLAHDAGVVIAAKLAARVAAPAVIAVTPLLARLDGGNLGIFAHPQFWSARLLGRRVQPPRGRPARLMLEGLAGEASRLRPDSGRFLRSFLDGTERLPQVVPCPGLLVCCPDDLLMPAIQGERLARRCDWSFDLHGTTGHFPMKAPGWEQLADRMHRWLVRTLGEDVLALLDDEPDLE